MGNNYCTCEKSTNGERLYCEDCYAQFFANGTVFCNYCQAEVDSAGHECAKIWEGVES